MFQENSEIVSTKLEKGALMVFQRNFMGISKKFKRCFKGVYIKWRGCFKEISRKGVLKCFNVILRLFRCVSISISENFTHRQTDKQTDA